MEFSGTVMSPILHAALSGSLECVKYLESKGARPVDTAGLSLLEAAVNSGNLELVRYLVSKEKPNKRTNDALCLAARLGHGDIVRYLVEEYSADVKTTGAARTYVRTSLNDFYSALVHPYEGSPLLQAAEFGHMALAYGMYGNETYTLESMRETMEDPSYDMTLKVYGVLCTLTSFENGSIKVGSTYLQAVGTDLYFEDGSGAIMGEYNPENQTITMFTSGLDLVFELDTAQ